jgi:hypothetical protein
LKGQEGEVEGEMGWRDEEDRAMGSRTFGTLTWLGIGALAALGILMGLPASGRSQTASGGQSAMTEERMPATSIAPADESAPARIITPRRVATTTHHATAAPAITRVSVEPVQAKLRLKKDTPIYEQPNLHSKHIEQGQAGKIIVATGTTQYYLRVRLKDGRSGYVLISAVDMVAPTDKIFALTRNAAVLDAPNRWGKKLSEVHQGHAVHVVGISLSYLKIKMRSGLEGFIPATALE